MTVEEGANISAAQTLTVRLATAPTANITVHVQEVDSVTGAAATISLLRLNGAVTGGGGIGGGGGGVPIVHTFVKGARPANAISLTVNVTVPNNELQEGVQATSIRVSIVTVAGGSAADPFHAKLVPIDVAVTVRDDDTVAVKEPVLVSSTTVQEVKSGAVAVSIPPGALQAGTAEVSIEQLPTSKLTVPVPTESFTTQTLVVDYGPPGTTFNAPVTITVPLDSGAFCLDKANHCQYVYRAGNGGAGDGGWQVAPGAAFERDAGDAGGGYVARLNVSHFSLYTVAVVAPTASLPAPSSPTVATFTERGAAVPIAPMLTAASGSGSGAIVLSASARFESAVPWSYNDTLGDGLTLTGTNCSASGVTATSVSTPLRCEVTPGTPTPTNLPAATTVSWNAAAGELTIALPGGVAMTPDQAAAALATVAYINPSRDPATASMRAVRFTLNEVYSSFTTAAGRDRFQTREIQPSAGEMRWDIIMHG